MTVPVMTEKHLRALNDWRDGNVPGGEPEVIALQTVCEITLVAQVLASGDYKLIRTDTVTVPLPLMEKLFAVFCSPGDFCAGAVSTAINDVLTVECPVCEGGGLSDGRALCEHCAATGRIRRWLSSSTTEGAK